MLVLVGASASGKSNIAKDLIKRFKFKKVVTTTTRKKRHGEENHVDYHFTSEKRFLKKMEKGEFLESVVYNDSYYGTPKDEAGIDKVLIVEPEGANKIYYHQMENVVFFYLDAPEKIRMDRMLERGDTLINIIDRLEKDEKHFRKNNLVHIDYIIDTSKETTEELTNKVAELYFNHVFNYNQMSLFDVFRNDDREDKKNNS